MMLSTLASSGNWKKIKKFIAKMAQNFDLNKYGFDLCKGFFMENIIAQIRQILRIFSFGPPPNNQIFMISSSK
jgi:hypothetical protein